MIRLMLILALASATSATADVLIYQFRSVSKNIGEGVEFTSGTRGYLVWNLADDHFTTVDFALLKGDKRYRVTDGNPLIVRVSGLRNREFTTFSSAGGSDGRYVQDYNRGLNTLLKLATGRTGRYPRTITGTAHSLNTSIGPRLTDYARTFVYSAARTVAANDAGKTETEIVTDLQTELGARGYTDLDSVAVVNQVSGGVTLYTRVGFEESRLVNQLSVGGRPVMPPLPPTPFTPPVAPSQIVAPPFPAW